MLLSEIFIYFFNPQTLDDFFYLFVRKCFLGQSMAKSLSFPNAVFEAQDLARHQVSGTGGEPALWKMKQELDVAKRKIKQLQSTSRQLDTPKSNGHNESSCVWSPNKCSPSNTMATLSPCEDLRNHVLANEYQCMPKKFDCMDSSPRTSSAFHGKQAIAEIETVL